MMSLRNLKCDVKEARVNNNRSPHETSGGGGNVKLRLAAEEAINDLRRIRNHLRE